MSLFTSKREKRLWIWTVGMVVGIYSTLGLTGLLADALIDSGLNVIGFLLGMGLVAAAVVLHAFRSRPGGIEIAVWLGIIAVYFLVLLRITVLAERSHIMEYGVVAIFTFEALRERMRQGARIPVPALLAIVATALVGVVDECIQLFLPNRVFDPTDMLFNTLAASMAVGSSLAIAWARRKVKKKR